MGADQNVAVMQRAYDAFNAGDIDTLTELFDESVSWHLPGRSSMAKDYEAARDARLRPDWAGVREHHPGRAAAIVRR